MPTATHDPAVEIPGDEFVDALFARLDGQRREALARAAGVTQTRERVAGFARGWWEEFCQVLERKVEIWNAKADAAARVTCTRNASGPVMLWHRSVEAELHLAEARVVMTGRVGETKPRDSPFIDFSEARGSVTAVLSDNRPKSPAEAADHVLGPLLTRAFEG